MSDAQSEKTPGLSADEEKEIDDNQPPRAAVLHEIIRTQGDHELERTLAALIEQIKQRRAADKAL